MSKIIGTLEWSTLPEPLTWHQAMQAVKQSQGWRLPTPAELMALWDYGTNTCAEFPVDAYADRTGYWTNAIYGPWSGWFFDRGVVSYCAFTAEHNVMLVREVA